MNLIVNGEAHHHDGQGTLAELFEELQAEPGRTAVMVNGEVVRKSRFGGVRLSDGDQVELIMITAGG